LSDIAHRYVTTAHFRKAILDRCMIVPVLALKFLLQASQHRGCGSRETTTRFSPTDPQVGQWSGPPDSSHLRCLQHFPAVRSSGNILHGSARISPVETPQEADPVVELRRRWRPK